MNQASKFIPCCFFNFLMSSRIIKYISFIPNFAVLFWILMDIMKTKFNLHLTVFHVKCKVRNSKKSLCVSFHI